MAISIEYLLPGGRNPVEDYVGSMTDKKAAKKILHNLERLEQQGFGLLRASDIFSKVTDDLYELRIPYSGLQHRIMLGKIGSKLYAIDAFSKKQQKLTQQEIKRSVTRIGELKNIYK